MRASIIKGFSMIELLMVISIIAILSIVALPQMLDFRQEAKVAASRDYTRNLSSAINIKRQQMILRCNIGRGVWPTLESIVANDLTENGAEDALCTISQLGGDTTQTRFLDSSSVEPPINPFNGKNDITLITSGSLCSQNPSQSGYFYNSQTGEFGHPLISPECSYFINSSSESSADSSESSSSSEVDCNSGYNVGPDTLCYNVCGQIVSDWMCIGSSSSQAMCTVYSCNCGGTVFPDTENCTMPDGADGNACLGGGGYSSIESFMSGCSSDSSSSNACAMGCGGFDSCNVASNGDCVGCWSYQNFDGTSCIDPPGCAASGGSWAPGSPTCSCPSPLTWDGNSCVDATSSSSDSSSSDSSSSDSSSSSLGCAMWEIEMTCDGGSSYFCATPGYVCPESTSSSSSSSDYTGIQGGEGCDSYSGLDRYAEISGQCYSVGMCTSGALVGQEVTPGYPDSPNGSAPCP